MDHIDRATEQARRRDQRSLIEKAAEQLYTPPRKSEPAATESGRRQWPSGTDTGTVNRQHAVAPHTSRQVHIDIARLKSQGILTPNSKRTQITEEFRLIKQRVLPNRWQAGAKSNNLIMVTSAGPGEGKTFTAINLAMSIACERDLSVLLVDSDLTKPSLLPRLGIKADKGLVDFLLDDSVALSDVLIGTNVERLSILPAGRSDAMSTELLGSDRMRELIEELAQRYPNRIVIFDAPPVLATSEPSVLAMHMHQIVFVVEAEATKRGRVKAALDLVNGCPNIGFVLNKSPSEFGSTQFGSYFNEYAKSADA